MKRLLILLFAASSLTAVGQLPDYLISSNPVMYFDFDGNAIESVNGDEPLLPSGDIAYVVSEERHVLELNGSGAHLYHPESSFPSFETVSMCIEVRLDQFGSGFGADLVPILSKWESTGTQNNEWTVYETEGQIWLWWTDSFNPGSAISFTHNWTAGEWHTICFEVGARAALWIDGEFVEEKIRDEFGSSNRLFRLGDWNNFQNPSYRTFDGAIDRLAIWSSLLTDNTSQAFHLGEAIAPGCTNPEACNYDDEANQEDGSCVACDVATAFCGEGTSWDPETQTCIVANPADINLDGCVQLNDLLDLLSAYGDCGAEESPWQCGDPLEYQGYDYETVQIGEQCWFAENLKKLDFVFPGNDDKSISEPRAYVQGYNGYEVEEAILSDNFHEYGALYNYPAVLNESLCPSGWSPGTDQDWIDLVVSLGIDSVEANTYTCCDGEEYRGDVADLLKDESWQGGINTSGFSALPAGFVRANGGGSFDHLGTNGYFWTTSEAVEEYLSQGMLEETAMIHYLFSGVSGVGRIVTNRAQAFSVRCLKDSE